MNCGTLGLNNGEADSMPVVRRVSLADFSRIYLNEKTVALGDKPASARVQMSDASQDGLAEHVFVAMAKPSDELNHLYPRVARPHGS